MKKKFDVMVQKSEQNIVVAVFKDAIFSDFSLIFHKRVATRMCVRRLETSGSALERINTEVFTKKF